MIYLTMIWKQQKRCSKAKDNCMLVLCAIRLWRRLLRHALLNDAWIGAPYAHSLSLLAKKGDFYNDLSESQRDFIDHIEPLNIEARYPSHKDKLLRSMTDAKCKEIIEGTKEIQKWIKEKL